MSKMASNTKARVSGSSGMGDEWTKESFWADLDAAGPDEVRVRLATKIYGDNNEKGGLAREWLLRRDQAAAAEAERLKNAAIQEQISISRSAKNASWGAVIVATVALIVSIAALAVSLHK